MRGLLSCGNLWKGTGLETLPTPTPPPNALGQSFNEVPLLEGVLRDSGIKRFHFTGGLGGLGEGAGGGESPERASTSFKSTQQVRGHPHPQLS